MAQALDSMVQNEALSTFSFRASNNSEDKSSASFFAFDTCIWFSAYGDASEILYAAKQLQNACNKFEQLFSKTISHSDISIMNDAKGRWVNVDKHTYKLLSAAIKYCYASEGVFDITIQPLMRLWDFKAAKVADTDALQRELCHVNWQYIQLKETNSDDIQNSPEKNYSRHHSAKKFFARLTDPYSSIDVGGIAKGYIADELVCILKMLRIENFSLNLGGNVVVHGNKPNGQKWNIGLRDPRQNIDPTKSIAAIELSSGSVVTSGISERMFFLDGRLFHHILNPKTGMPINCDSLSVSVICDKSLDAEGYSTTLLAIGIDGAKDFMKKHPEIKSVIYIKEDGSIIVF